jgi:hypothetical protein
MTIERPMFPPRAESVDSFSGGSSTPAAALATPHGPDDVNSALSGTPRGDPVTAASIPANHPPAIRRGDSGTEVADPAAIAPPALTTPGGSVMNTMVSAASLATAMAVGSPSIASEVSHVDPVYAMIESHRAASIAFDKAVNHPGVGDRRHPQNAEAERVNDRARRECRKCTKQLFAFRPSTLAGMASLLRYISTLQDWEMPSYFTEDESVRGVKKLCKTMAAALDAAGSISPPEPNDAELLGWIDRLWALVPRYRQVYAQFEAEEANWFKRRPNADAPDDEAFAAAQIQYDQIWEEIHELERRVFSTKAHTLNGVKAKARWHLQFTCSGDVGQLDGGNVNVESLFLELGGDEPDGKSELDPRLGGVDHGGRSRPPVDPIFAAIEAHRVAYAEYLRECGEGEDPPDESLRITDHAANALLATEPMTISGAAALLAYFSEQTIQDETYFPEGAGEGETVPFAAALTGLASRSLSRHASFAGGSPGEPARTTRQKRL